MNESITQHEQIHAGVENFIGGPVTHEEIANLARTARLGFLEEQKRAEVFIWINRYFRRTEH